MTSIRHQLSSANLLVSVLAPNLTLTYNSSVSILVRC